MGQGKKVEIDHKTFEGLCAIQCTKKEVAQVIDCSEDTIERFCKREYKMTFEEARNKFGADGRASLRRTQFALAKKSAAMAIFLGKQYLGQRDSFDVVDNTPIEKLDAILTGIRNAAAKKQEADAKK